ncbi:MAG: cysteine desulfurase [Coriobacteriaceae bacterium]|nr:cysteine desulfurase [Coriobacteriaceae bacterium]
MQEVYLDNAATTKPYPEVVEAVTAAMEDGFGNASTLYKRGRHARERLEESRAVLADALGVEPEEVYFTSGGTESNNLAIVGSCRCCREERDGIVCSTLEHPSVTKTVRGLRREGWPVSYVRVPHGDYDFDVLASSLDENTALITCMYVQNELGYIFPLEQIVDYRDRYAPQALVHTDAVQAFGKVAFFPHELGVDLASLSGHKIGGPQGIGALFVKKDTSMFTTAFGGGQEQGLRSGTEALPLIIGFAKAVEISCGRRAEKEREVAGLRRRLEEGIRALRSDVVVNSREDGSPYLFNFSLPDINSDDALAYLSERDVFLSKTSACESLHPGVPPEDWRKKHPLVVQLAGVKEELVTSTFRVSFSQQSTEGDVDGFLAVLQDYFSRV